MRAALCCSRAMSSLPTGAVTPASKLARVVDGSKEVRCSAKLSVCLAGGTTIVPGS